MQQPIPDEMKQEYARLPLFELIDAGERPASVAESLVDYDPSKDPSSPSLNADLDGTSQTSTPKKGKRASSGSKSSRRTPSPPKSPKSGKKGAAKKDKEHPAPAQPAAPALVQDASLKNAKPK